VVVLCVAGCGGAPSDPVKNLDWHVKKVIAKQSNANEEIRQVTGFLDVMCVLAAADAEAYEKLLEGKDAPSFLNTKKDSDYLMAFFNKWIERNQTWYKLKYTIDDNYKCDVTKTDSLTTPLMAQIESSCKMSCSNLFTTKEEAEKA